MSYAAAIDQLNAMTPELFAKAGQPRRKFSLDEVRILLSALGNPERRFPAVLIAGTNGKGSTAATLASILTEAGLRTGLYTSPHLERPNERIRVGREEIADGDFARLFFLVSDKADQMVRERKLPQMPSFFEMLTALAFLYLAESKVEIAVLEVGMGGRLDATNVVEPLVSVVTDISLDHMEWLGPTIAAIAREKAGILRAGGTMITLPQHPEANQVLGHVATELGVRGVSAVPYMPANEAKGPYTVEALGATVKVDSPLKGAHQQRNVALAIAAAVELAEQHGFAVCPAAIEEGIRRTEWPGRLERMTIAGVEWVLDVAHNPAGAWALRAGLRNILEERKPRILIFSCLRDKPVAEMAQILFPLFERVIVAPIHAARATAVEDLLAAAKATGTAATAAETVREALQLAQENAAGGVVVVSGSVYLVGEARAMLTGEFAVGKSEAR
ncbi:MAG: bifunctional folylpolyglutamate synthase/dihydrofolate synthase [Terracidiphilus sp.]|nr:bifunctional folylpolyglutamate synthase/dihydrofolate synthase [Terracidiphilus sp.]MDR3799541.1 bifunctional folylpolyglutamate synthase/dihydrofolate synthase [Terracidiphilus sp.]